MKTVTRLPAPLGWILFWLVFTGLLFLPQAALSPQPAVRLLSGGLAALFLISAVGLFRLRPWGRILSADVFCLSVLLRAYGLTREFKWSTVSWLLLSLYWAVYLYLPSTKRLFEASAGSRVGVARVVARLLLLIPLCALVVVLVFLQAPKALSLGLPMALTTLYVFFLDRRFATWVEHRLARRPDDLDAAAWEAVRRALERRRRGDPDGAEALLPAGSDGPSVRAFRGLLRADRARSAETLDRALYDASWIAPVAARETLLRECREPGLRERVAARADLIDAILRDEARPASIFAGEADAAIQRITGQFFMSNEVFQHREAWEKRRPLCSGDRALVWLTVRLWDAQAPEAALHVAGLAGDPQLEDLARLSLRLDQAARGLFSEEWVAQNSLNLCLLPVPADAARLLFLDSPYMGAIGADAVASRLSARLELVSRLRRLRDDYPAESWVEIPWLIAQLTGHPPSLRTRTKVERWWESARPVQAGFDGAFISGLDAARREDWARAEAHFAEAEKAWPERTCAVYNRALMLLSLDRAAEAETVFSRLAAAEPNEAVFWMRAGDACRLQRRIPAAIDAYRKAARLGGLEGEVGIRLGLTLAADGREDEAARELDRAARAGDADADQLDDLATYLESEGVYRLASRYREQAFLKRLGDKPSRDDAAAGDDDGLTPA